jgi:putative tricarboxylic transport membrane protein
MIRYDFPVAPMVLAQILGSMMESNYRRAVVMFHGDVTQFFMRPIAMTILALAVFTTIVAVRRQRQALKQEAAQLAALEQSSSQ